MLAAAAACNGLVLLIGTDCPALTEVHIHSAANALRDGADVILIPAEDGGYVLIDMRSPQPRGAQKRFSLKPARASSRSVLY